MNEKYIKSFFTKKCIKFININKKTILYLYFNYII